MKFSKAISVALALAAILVTMPLRASENVTLEPATFKPNSGEPVSAETGTLVVPESRRKKSDQKISLKFVRFRSTAKKPGSPIVYLAGGPGGSGIDAARGTRFPLFMALREFGDVIAFDQRGTGASQPGTKCTESYMLPFTEPADPVKASAILAAGAKKCFERLRAEGIDPSAYNTLESADDLDDLRKALGAEKITLWGISYGTHLALATLRTHGEHIERAILAGVEPLDHTLKLPGDQQSLLNEIARLAKSDPAIAKRLPDLIPSIARIVEHLRKEPATVTLVHPAMGQSVPVQVGAFDLQFVLAGMLEGPDSFAGMPDFIARLEDRDWTALALQAARSRMGSVPSAMSIAMDCASGSSGEWRARVAAEAKSTLLADVINFPFPGICEGLGIPDLGDDFRKPVRSEVPVLLISGTLDGRTSPRNAERVMPGLPNAQQLVIQGAGHSDPLFLSSPKILDAMKAFMRGKKLPTAPIVLEPMRFIPPRKVVELADEVLSRYVGTYQIQGDDGRKVVKAGSLLYSIRGSASPFPLRPISETDFFWEGMPAAVHFEVSPEGKVLGMSVDPDGSGKKSLKSAKIE